LGERFEVALSTLDGAGPIKRAPLHDYLVLSVHFGMFPDAMSVRVFVYDLFFYRVAEFNDTLKILEALSILEH